MQSSANAPKVVAVSFSAEIAPHTVEALLNVCSGLANQGVQDLLLLLSTPGGSVMHGLNAYNVLRSLPFKLVTHNVGSVDSIGNVIFLAGEQRYACANATFMFHGVGMQVAQPSRLAEKDLREKLDSLMSDQKRIASVISERTRLPVTDIEEMFLEGKTKGPGFAKEMGIIDDIRDVELPPGTPIQQLVFQR